MFQMYKQEYNIIVLIILKVNRCHLYQKTIEKLKNCILYFEKSRVSAFFQNVFNDLVHIYDVSRKLIKKWVQSIQVNVLINIC